MENDKFKCSKLFIYFKHSCFQGKQGRKRPLDTPKRMIERREREREKEIYREGGGDKREAEREM